MLFALDELPGDLSLEELDGIGALFRACREGRHALVCSRSVLEELQSLYGARLSEVDRAFTSYLLNRYTTLVAPLNNAGHAVSVSRNCDGAPSFQELAGGALNRSSFVTEGEADLRFYLAAFKALNPSTRISCAQLPGGGSSIPAVFRSELSEGAISFAVIDSDKAHPDSKSSQNVALIAEALGGVQGWRACFHVLEVRAIENLVPDGLLQEICDDSESSFVQALLELRAKSPVHAKFLAMKKGLQARTIRGKKFDGEKKCFWLKVLPNLGTDWEIPKCSNDLVLRASEAVEQDVEGYSGSLGKCEDLVSIAEALKYFFRAFRVARIF